MTTKEELRHRIDFINDEIKELQHRVADIEEEIDDLEHSAQMSDMVEAGLWKPKEGGKYYYVGDDGKIYNNVYNRGWENSENRIKFGNCYQTKEQAEKALEHKKIETQLRDIAARLNKGTVIDWNNYKQKKWYIIYSLPEQKIFREFTDTVILQGGIYCLDKNFKDVAIQEIGEERLKEYFKDGRCCNLFLAYPDLRKNCFHDRYEKYRQALDEIEKKMKNMKKESCNNCGWHNTDGCEPDSYTCGDYMQILSIIKKVREE